MLVLFAAAAGADTGATYEVAQTPDGVRVNASFTSFANVPLTLAFPLARRDIAQSVAAFGYTQEEKKQVFDTCVAEHCAQADFDARLEKFFRDHGVTPARSGGAIRLSVDVQAAVVRDRPRLRSVAAAFEQLAAAKHLGAGDTFDAAVAMVQTALRYRNVPNQEGGREILGFYPPAQTLAQGWGDCDTKSALLAALMTNFSGVRMIGVHVPNHYLVGIARVPRSGDAYMEYQGQPFVLVEAAGPGWLQPGTISDSTQAALNVMDGVRIDPFF